MGHPPIKRRRMHEIRGHQVHSLLAKLRAIFSTNIAEPLPLEILHAWQDINNNQQPDGLGKHGLQEVSILGHLQQILPIGTLLSSLQDRATSKDSSRNSNEEIMDILVLDLGAGVGRLSDRMQSSMLQWPDKATTNAPSIHKNYHFVLMDRATFAPNSTKDSILEKRSMAHGGSFCRLVQDIRDLDLAKLLEPSNKEEKSPTRIPCSRCILMSKHLCGPACDFAIDALVRYKKDDTTNNKKSTCCVMAVATCCQYLCTWESFSGKDALQAMGMTQEDFVVLVTASQWASMAKIKRSKRNVSSGTHNHQSTSASSSPWTMASLQRTFASIRKDLDDMNHKPLTAEQSAKFEQDFSRASKIALGVRCKHLLDLARAAQLATIFAHVRLVRYTDQSIEDRILLAWD